MPPPSPLPRTAAASSFPAAGRRGALEAELRGLGAEAAFIQPTSVTTTRCGTWSIRPSRFGRIDAAVNNAGTEGQKGLVVDQTAESYAATFDTNVLGVLLSLKHELRVMTAQKSGSIVNISSTYGHQGAAGASVYVGSKHAVEGITKSAALEGAASGVRVNAVAPGPTDTGMLDRFTGNPQNKAALVSSVPLGRIGKPDEIARAIVFLASASASFMTGQVVSVDGGKAIG